MTARSHAAAALTHRGGVYDLRLTGALYGRFFVDDAVTVIVVGVADLDLGHARVDLIGGLGQLVVVHLTGDDAEQA